jgi:signal transduction histidine kinase
MSEKMDHLNKIVEQILAFARSTEPNLSPVNLNQLVADLGLLVRHKLNNQHIELEYRLAAELPPVMADATQLEQAFLNLTLNAVEAMPAGGKLTIATRLLRLPRSSGKASHVVIEFKDTGEGMSEEARRRAFSSLLSTTKSKGTGLGLAIVARVVETHRGRVKVMSRLGRGTTIRIVLPL